MDNNDKIDFGLENYARRSNSSDRLVDFSCSKMRDFLQKYDEDFNIIIYWEKPFNGYYSIPYKHLKTILKHEYSYKEEGKRWVFTIKNDILKCQNLSLNVSMFKHLGYFPIFNETFQGVSDPEGNRKLSSHLRIERDSDFIRKIKASYYKEDHRMPCQICGISFVQKYGELGCGFIEAHHKVPLSDLKDKENHRIEDFVFVCANCHRMLHRGNPVLKKRFS